MPEIVSAVQKTFAIKNSKDTIQFMQTQGAKSATYTNGIVTFVDILGFNSVLASASADMVCQVLDTFHSRYRAHTSGMNDEWQHRYSLHMLSDCVFRTFSTGQNSIAPFAAIGFSQEFLHAACIQGKLIYDHGRLIRGAVTYGPFYAAQSQNMLYGPAVSRAYTFESNLALYPRICVDPKAIDAFYSEVLPAYPFDQVVDNMQTGSRENMIANFFSWITRGDDGIWFVDYLRIFRAWFPDGEDPCKFIRKHKQIIEEGLSHNGDDFKAITAKYLWLANYHNRTIQIWSSCSWGESVPAFNPNELRVDIPNCYQDIKPSDTDARE